MRPDQPRGIARAESAREVAKPRNAEALRARRRRLALEALEARTLMAVLPAPTVATQTDVSGTTGTSDASSPVIAVDPTNPLNLAAVWTVHDAANPITFNTPDFIEGATSDDGGITWNAFAATPTVGTDPSSSTGNPFGAVTDGSVAWDRSGNIYIAEVQKQSAGSNTTGELLAAKFAVSGGMASMTSMAVVSAWWQGHMGSNQVEEFSPTIAVDGNVASFTDPDTGKTQTDAGAGDVYIAATEERAVPSGFTGDWNPLTTTLWASTDGGATFPNHLTGNSGLGLGNVGQQREASPKIAISQGTADGSVVGGTVTLVWDDFGIFSGAGPLPLDAIVDQQVVAGGAATLTGAALVQTTIVRDDPGANYGSGSPAAPPQTHSVATPADAFGVGPAPAIASDNTLGSFSPFQGRIYVTYADRYDPNRIDDLVTGQAAAGNPAANTDIFITFLDPTTGAWSAPVQVNDDVNSTKDGYSDSFVNTLTGPITGRTQFQSQVAVDDSTGTVAVSFLDTRYDAAQARVATTVTTSIDGGQTFSPQNMAFADVPNTAFDAIAQKTVTLGPIPENQSGQNGIADGNFSFGEHQGLAFEAGHLYPAFSANFNGGPKGTQRLDILVSPSTVSDGPRIVSATMGPVGEPGDRINVDKNADGSPIADAFQVTFDRPVDPSTFNTLPTQAFADIFTAKFENGLDGFAINNSPNSDPNYTAGLWHLSTGRGNNPGHSATHSLYYGSGETASGGGNYVGTAGFANAGTVTSPAINLPANKVLELTFNYFLKTEGDAPGFDAADVMVIDLTNSAKSAIVDDNDVGTGKLLDDGAGFHAATIDLSAFAGDQIEVQFGFDTMDSLSNNFEGWYLDDVSVIQPAMTADVQVQARDSLGNLLPTQPQVSGVTPLDAGAFGATTFLVHFSFPNGYMPPETATYSYSVGPDISDRIRTLTPAGVTVNGNNMDQNGNAVAGETGGALQNDAFANPNPVNGVPFQLPYTTTTLPLITTGPHVASAIVYRADGTPSGSTQLTTPVAIPSATPGPGNTVVNGVATAPLTIGGDADLQVTDLKVTLSIAIPDTTDLVVSLVAPDGTIVVLSQQEPAPPASGANFTNTTFDDGSAVPIAAGAPPYDAVFAPDSPLSALNGHLVVGQWKLKVENTSTSDVGQILGWSLQVSSEAVALDKPISQVPIVFDRNMDPSTINAASVLAVIGPDGVIAGPYNIVAAPDLDPLHPDPDPMHARTYLVSFPAQSSSASFSVVLASSIKSEAGDAIDVNLNAGVAALRGEPTGTNVKVNYTSPSATAITPGVTDSTIVVPATDTYAIQAGVQLQLNIVYPNDPDLTATLITPGGVRVILFSGVGATGTHANFQNTIFSDTAPTPIQQGGPSFSSITGFQPQQPLDLALVGQLAAGTYTLEITDGSGTRTGTLTGWNLTFNKTVPSAGLGEPVADRTTIPFRVFNLDPTSAASVASWTAVGPAGIAAASGAGTNGQTAGRVTAVAVDPSDPSGNTVYAGGASGGVWRTTDFLTNGPQGPTWTPLTDFGPAFAANIGSIAIFPRNGDPGQSVIYAATGEGDALGDPTQSAQATGIGVLRSMDGGQTWTLLDSSNNNLPFSSANPTTTIRDHIFARGQGTASYKIAVDPKATTNGGIVVFMAISGVDPASGVGGIWRSLDSGQTWTQVLKGQATDLVPDLNSGTGVSGGNLQTYYAAIEGVGVFQTTNQGQSWLLMTGGVGDPLIQQGARPSQPVPVAAPLGTPNGAKGRIVLARPALTGNALEDVQYQGWLYAAVIAAPGDAVFSAQGQLDGLYMTKDFGQNWVKVTIPTDAGLPTNNTGNGNVQLTGSTTPAGTPLGLGNFDLSLTVDPNNPNVVYLGGTDEFGTTGLIRVDTTGINDAHSFYSDQDLADGGALAVNSKGGLSEANPALAPPPIQPPYASNPIDLGGSAAINLLRDPTQPFIVGATVRVTNAGAFSNTGAGVSWIPFDQALQPDPFDASGDAQSTPTRGQHQVIAIPDSLTGGTRLIFADDQGIYSVVTDGAGSLIGSIGGLDTSVPGALDTDQGETKIPSGSRNGDLQIAQLYSAAAQPSNAAANQAVLPGFFYGNTSENGQPQSDPNIVNNGANGSTTTSGAGYGDLSWAGDSASAGNPTANYAQGSGTGVGVDQTGSGSVYQFKWPISLVDVSLPPTDFLQYNGLSRTNGLVLASNNGDVPDPEWPFRTGSNFAVNPIAGQQVIISSQTGQIFRTENNGGFWSVIGQPNALDGSYAPAVAFGAPDPNGPIGIGNLDNFLYAGTTDGNIFITQTGGGGGGGNAWTNTTAFPATNPFFPTQSALNPGYFQSPATAGSVDYSPVEQVVTDPTRGTHDAYAVTAGNATFAAPSYTPLSVDGNIAENIISVDHPTGHEEVYIGKDVDISRLSVTVNVAFSQDQYLTLSLVAPDGTVYPLASKVGGTGSGYTNTTFDDQANNLLTGSAAPFTGTFKPVVNGVPTIFSDRYYISDPKDFFGKDIEGVWTLLAASSNTQNGTGQINNWSLNYTTQGGVYFNADTTDPASTWQNISGDLYLFTAPSFGDASQSDTVARSLTSIVADWRYAIPDDLSDPTGPSHPILYIGGDSGVFQSVDGGATWTKYPASGGDLPEVKVTGLSLVYGDINSTTGRPVAQPTDPDLLTASTYGRGEFAIELAPILLSSSIELDPTAPASELPAITGVGSDAGSNAADKITADTHPFIAGYGQETAFGSTVTINIYDETAGTPDVGNLVGTGTTDGAGHFSVQITGNIVRANPSQFGDLITLSLDAVAPNGAVGVAVPFTFTLDATKPATPPPPALEPASDSGRFNNDGITDVTDPTFDVSNVEPNAELQLFRSGVLVATILNVGAVGGTIAIQDPGPVPDGMYSYTTRQTDLAGNVGSMSGGTPVTIITVLPAQLNPPDLEAASDTGKFNNDNVTSVTNPTFDVSVVGAHDTLELLRNGSVVKTIVDVGAAGGTVAIQDPGPVQPDAVYTYTAVELDLAGNMSPPSQGLAVTIDTTKPIVPTNLKLDPASDSGSKGDGVTNVTNPFFDMSGIEAFATVFLQRAAAGPNPVFSTVNAGGTFTTTGGAIQIQDPGPVPDGNYLYRAFQVDLAGNVGPFTSSIPIRILSGTPVSPGPLTLDATTDTGYGPVGDPTRSDDTTSATLIRFPLIDIGGIVAGSTVKLFRNGVLVNSTVSAAGGTVQLSDPLQPYNDGTYGYTAQQIDASGDASPISGVLSVTFDNMPPAAPLTPRLEPGSDSGTIGDGTTNVTTPIFDVGNVEANAELKLLRDGVAVQTLLHVAGGTVAIQDPGAAAGVHTYSAIQVDEAGNASALGGGAQITIITTGPTFTPSVPVLTAASDSGASSTDGVTNVTSPVFNVASAQAGVTVQLLRFTNGVGVVVGSRVGPGTIQDPGPLASGYYGYEAREVDVAGNVGPASALGVILVVTASAPPSAPALAAASDSGVVGDGVTNVTHPVFNLNPSGLAAIAPGATVTLFRNGVAVGSRVGAGPITDNGPSGQGLSDGSYIYTAIQTDLAGNVSTASTPAAVTILTSIAAPGTPVLSSPPGGTYTNVTHPVITIPTAPAGSFVSLFRNGLLVGGRSGAGPITDNGPTGTGLPPGTYTYTAYAQDQAGNTSVASGALVLTIATSLAAPPTPILDPASDSGTAGDGITNVNKPTIDLTASGPQVTVVLLRKAVGAPDTSYVTVGTRVGSGAIQDTGGGAGLADGSYYYVAYQVDPAGNVSAPGGVATVTIRTAPPIATAAPTLDPSTDSSPGKGGVSTNSKSPILDVTGSTPSTVVPVAVVLYRKPTGSTDASYVAVAGVAAAAGTLKIADPGPLAQGSYTYATRQIDVAGNVGPLSAPKTINILTVPPATPTIRLNPTTDTGTVGDNVTSSRSPVFIGTGQPGTTIVLINSATNAVVGVGATSTVNGSYSIAAGTLNDQTLPILAFDVDAAGNVSPAPASLTVRIVTVGGDYNGDGKADLASFTPGATGAFNLAVTTAGTGSIPFGQAGDIPVSGDFDGDGKADVGVYRPSIGQYIIQQSTAGIEVVGGGIAGVSLPVVGDFLGNGKSQPAFFDPQNGQWSFSDGTVFANLGSSGDEPVPADFDGDGKADVAIFRPSTGQWFVLRSTAGAEIVTLGNPTDLPVPADFDGDGKADIAAYRPSTGQWFVLRSTAGAEVVQFGATGDIPVPQDYDGDGKADLALFRPSTAQWIIIQSAGGSRIQTSGNVNDIPVPAPYVDRAGSLGLRSLSADVILGSTGLDLGSSASAFSASPTVGSGVSSTSPSDSAVISPIASPPTRRERLAQARAARAEKLAQARQARLAELDARHHDRALESLASSAAGRRHPLA